MIAFRGDPAVKAAFLRDLEDPENFEGPILREAPIRAWSEAGLLPESVLSLVAYIADPVQDDSPLFMMDLVQLIEPGADLSTLPHAWLAAMFERLTVLPDDPELRGCVEDIIALHNQAARGIPVGRSEWRSGRVALARFENEGSDPDKGVAIVAASCWDMKTMPGALGDTLNAWRALAFDDARNAECWTDEDQAGLAEVTKAVRASIEAELGGRPDPNIDAAGFAQYRKHYGPLLHEKVAKDKDPLYLRWGRLRERFSATRREFNRHGRTLYTELVLRMPTA